MANNINLPEGYQRIEYLQSTGTQYIDTGIIPDTDTGIQVEFEVPSKYRNNIFAIFGLYNESGTDTRWYAEKMTVAVNQTNPYVMFGRQVYWAHGAATFLLDEKQIISLNYLNDGKRKTPTLSGPLTEMTFTPLYSIYICAMNGYKERDNFIGKIYNVKISQGSEIVMDLIPVRVGTTGYMYDTVSGELFGNAGTGEFILGPDIASSFGEGFLNYTGLKRLISWIKGALNSKQDTLTFDSTPTVSSTNPVTSGGLYTVITNNEKTTAAALNDLNDKKANTADLATVAISGNYNDLTNKPTIPTIPDLSKGTTTGNGNAVTNIAVNGHTITLTKGTTFASVASPTFTGTPAAPTATAGTNTTQIATTAFVQTAVNNKVHYVANLLSETAANYITEPEFKSVKINGSSTNAASSSNCVLLYDTTNECLKFIFN